MPKTNEDHPSPAEEHDQKLQKLRKRLIEGEASGDAGELDFETILRNARKNSGGSPADE